MNEKKMRTIFSQKLAGILMQKGFVLVEMRPNTNGNGKNVFYFNDSPELEKVIVEAIERQEAAEGITTVSFEEQKAQKTSP